MDEPIGDAAHACARRNGSYGVDAPYLLPIPAALMVADFLEGVASRSIWPFVGAAAVAAFGAFGLYASRRGKFVVWARLIDRLGLRGDERILDLGCGRGAVLLMAAQHLTTGRAVGVDLWKKGDQSGNAVEATARNAAAEGVADRVELHTADMTDLPFEDASFDLVVSSLAIHNVKGGPGRDKAIAEAVRVLRPGGRLMIADVFATRRYRGHLARLGMRDVTRRDLGPRLWWGGPWVPTHLVTAVKPASRAFQDPPVSSEPRSDESVVPADAARNSGASRRPPAASAPGPRRWSVMLSAAAALLAGGRSAANHAGEIGPIGRREGRIVRGEVVRVESGLLRGTIGAGIVSFLGVPYAAPPIGPLRWAPPQRARSWRAVRDAARPASGCPDVLGEQPNGSEDCLYLNIRAPRASSGSRPKPVMVWLHGGGLSSGTGNTYDARRMVTEGDVIVVTVDSRLNIFGYFGYPGLNGSGTFGLQDQQAALRWIRRNVAVFGGDPGSVTLFGESGGAIATCMQLTSPGARGLIDRAIMQSGAATTSWPRNTPNAGSIGSFLRPLRDVEAAGRDLASKLGCSDRKGSDALRCLRDLPVSTILAHSADFGYAAYGGPVLPRNPVTALKEGRFLAVPVLSGYNRDEGRAMASGLQLSAGGQPMTDDQYRELLVKAFGDRTAEVEAHYPRSGYSSAALAWSAIYTDRMFACPQIAATRALARRAPAFAYEFADPHGVGLIPFLPGFPSGASHSGELPMLFDMPNAPVEFDVAAGRLNLIPLSDDQTALAHVMVRYWTRFARTGDPNGSGTPPWPHFDAGDAEPRVQVLAPGPGGVGPSRDAAVNHRCAFWAMFLD